MIIAFLIADGLTAASDRILSGFVNQYTIPIAFGAFCLVVLYEAIIAAEVTSGIASAFDSLGPLAYFAFFFVNLVPTAVLYLDFLLRYHFRRMPKPSKKPFVWDDAGLPYASCGHNFLSHIAAILSSHFKADPRVSRLLLPSIMVVVRRRFA